MEKILVSGWNNGKKDKRGNGYGIRVGKKNRYLFKDLTEFILSIKGNVTIKVYLTKGFWKNCPEFRNTNIGKWMHDNNFAPLKNGKNPKFILSKIDEQYFRLESL